MTFFCFKSHVAISLTLLWETDIFWLQVSHLSCFLNDQQGLWLFVRTPWVFAFFLGWWRCRIQLFVVNSSTLREDGLQTPFHKICVAVQVYESSILPRTKAFSFADVANNIRCYTSHCDGQTVRKAWCGEGTIECCKLSQTTLAKWTFSLELNLYNSKDQIQVELPVGMNKYIIQGQAFCHCVLLITMKRVNWLALFVCLLMWPLAW